MEDNGREIVSGLSDAMMGPAGRDLQLSVQVSKEMEVGASGFGVGEGEGLAGLLSATI